METTNPNTPAHRPANLKLTKQMLDNAANTKDILDLPAVRQNWLDIYKKTSGKTDGMLRFEAERVLFLQAYSSSLQLQQCSRESIYSVWIELALSGLTLRDGLTYVIPRKTNATFQISWKGRLEQITEMAQVVHAQAPQVVWDCDVFQYELGMNPTVNKHIPVFPRPAEAKIIHVYMVIHFTYGVKCFFMNRDEVISIRDNFSDSYKTYLKDLPQADTNGMVTKSGKNGSYQTELKKPMWVTSEEQSFRKTLVKRVYNNMDKLPHQKLIDKRMKENEEAHQYSEIDVDELVAENNLEAAFSIEDHENTPYAEEIKDEPAAAQQPVANVQQNTGSGRAQTQPTNVQPASQQPQHTNVDAGFTVGDQSAPFQNNAPNMFQGLGNPNESF